MSYLRIRKETFETLTNKMAKKKKKNCEKGSREELERKTKNFEKN